MKNIAIAAALLLLTSLSFSRHGESVTECEERYGRPIHEDGDWKTYRAAGFTISCQFFRGTCSQIIYRKQEPNTVGVRSLALSVSEVEFLLSIYNPDKWTTLTEEWEPTQLYTVEGSDWAAFLFVKSPDPKLVITTLVDMKRESKSHIESLKDL